MSSQVGIVLRKQKGKEGQEWVVELADLEDFFRVQGQDGVDALVSILRDLALRIESGNATKH